MDDFNGVLADIEDEIQLMLLNVPAVDSNVKSEYQNIQYELLGIYKEYSQSYSVLKDYVKNNTTRVEYASGGEGLHRGYYCPSPIIDKLLGNVKRGKLLKRLTSRSKNYYKYLYDLNNSMVGIEIYYDRSLNESEYVIHTASGTVGVSFNEMWKNITFTSMVKMTDNRITLYATLLPDFVTGKQHHFIHVEKYHYDGVGMCGATICWEGIPELSLLTEENYRFNRDEHGNITGYWSDEEYYNW